MRGPAQALVEFALAISVFMLLVVGTFDLARAYLAYTVVANVAREASRYGAAHPTDMAGAVQAGRNLAVGIDTSATALSLSVDPPTVPQTVGAPSYIRAYGTYKFRSLTPGVAALLGDPITITVDTSTLVG